MAIADRGRAAPGTGGRSGRGLRKALLLVGGALLLTAIAIGGYGIWTIFLKPAGPAAVGTAAPAVPSNAPISSLASTDGTWTVDPTIGSFSDFSDSWVGYRVQEQLVSIGGNIAVGRTPDVSGSLTLDGATVTSVDITADLTTLQSDESMRDGRLRDQGIQTGQFPTATFSLTQPIDLGTVPADGQKVSATAIGELTLHGVTQSVQIPLNATLTGDLIAVNGSLPIVFSDYQIEQPNSFKVVTIDDHGVMELQLFLRHD